MDSLPPGKGTRTPTGFSDMNEVEATFNIKKSRKENLN